MKKTSGISVILCAFCAVIWTIRAILEVLYKTYNDSIWGFGLNILCAVLWIAAFILNLKNYRSNKDE